MEPRGHMDSRGRTRALCHGHLLWTRVGITTAAFTQVELPANTKIEYKYVILEEQVSWKVVMMERNIQLAVL